MMKHCLAVAAAFFLAVCASAQAQVPSYAQPPSASDDEQIHGRILAFDGQYNLTVRDERGYADTVRLHQGTIINPVGLTLEPGMIVNIIGYNAGDYLDANEVDTPYRFYGGMPYYAGHPWKYYGPEVSLGFFFGNGGWWHGESFHGGYHYLGGTRVYENVHVTNVYRGGEFRGRVYAAPRERGGYYPHAHAVRSEHPMGQGNDMRQEGRPESRLGGGDGRPEGHDERH